MDPSKDLQELISRLAVALGIGLLIGLERGWRRRQASPGSRAARVRTFAISGLLGGVIAALAQPLSSHASGGAASVVGGIVLGFGFAACAAVIALFNLDLDGRRLPGRGQRGHQCGGRICCQSEKRLDTAVVAPQTTRAVTR